MFDPHKNIQKIEVLVPTNHDRFKKILDFCGVSQFFVTRIFLYGIFSYIFPRCLSHCESPAEEKEKERALKGEADYLEPWRTGATEGFLKWGNLYPRAVSGSNKLRTTRGLLQLNYA